MASLRGAPPKETSHWVFACVKEGVKACQDALGHLDPQLGKGSNTTLRILSVRGVPPLPPFTDFSPDICLQKGLKMVFFAQKTPDFGLKNRLRIFFSKKGVTDLGGTSPPPFTDKIRKVVFDVLPNTPQISLKSRTLTKVLSRILKNKVLCPVFRCDSIS